MRQVEFGQDARGTLGILARIFGHRKMQPETWVRAGVLEKVGGGLAEAARDDPARLHGEPGDFLRRKPQVDGVVAQLRRAEQRFRTSSARSRSIPFIASSSPCSWTPLLDALAVTMERLQAEPQAGRAAAASRGRPLGIAADHV